MRFSAFGKFVLITTLVLLVDLSWESQFLRRNLQQLTEEQIRNLISAKIQQKMNAVNQRYQLISRITLAEDAAKSLRGNLVDAKVAAQAAYRTYYNARMKCDGFAASSNTIGIKGEISDDVCLEFPIALESLSLYTLKTQLEGYSLDSKIAQKSYNIQNDFLADVGTELAIYQDLKTFFTAKNNANLSQKYGNQASTTLNTYNTEKMVRDGKKQNLDGAKSTEASVSQTVQQLESQIKAQADTCYASLSALKADLDGKLAAAALLNQQVAQKDQIVSQGFDSARVKLTELKRITSELKALAEQYAAAVGVA